MKARQKITQVELKQQGWIEADVRFGDYQIWKKGYERILWFKEWEQVVTVYEVKGGCDEKEEP